MTNFLGNMFFLTRNQVLSVCETRENELFEIVRKGYILHFHGESVCPGSFFLNFSDRSSARIIGLPSYVSGPDSAAGIKWIASFPENLALNLERASALIILNDTETGYPYACLEGGAISALRTANSAVLAASEIKIKLNKPLSNLGIIGNGLISKEIYKSFKRRGWQFDRINLYDSFPNESIRFKNNCIDYEDLSNARIYSDVEELVQESNLVIFATTASKPYFNNMSCIRHLPVILHISLRDLGTEIIKDSYNIVDDRAHILNANTSIHLTYNLLGSNYFVFCTIGEMLCQDLVLPEDRPIIFSPMGIGVLDIMLAKSIYEDFPKDGGCMIENFFGSSMR